MATNIGGAALGDLILGASPSSIINRSVTSTLTLTQQISSTYEAVPQTLTLSQSISYTMSRSRTVTSTLTLTQTVKAPIFITVTSTYSPSQNCVESHDKPRTVSQSIGLTQDIVAKHVANRLIVQGLNWSHARSYNAVFNRTISQSWTPIQTVLGSFCKTVNSTLTLSHLISFEKLKHIQHVLDWQQQILYNANFGRSMNQIFGVFQTISKTTIYNRSVTSNLNLSQTVIAPKVRGISQSLGLTQTVLGVASKGVKHTMTYDQTITYNIIHNASVTHSLGHISTVDMARSQNLRVHHGFGMNSIVKQHREFNKTIAQNLGLNQTIRFSTYVRTVAQNLSLTQTVAYTPVYPRSVSSTLNLSQTIGVVKVYKRSLTDNLVFLPNRSVYVGMGGVEYYTIDNVQYALIPAYAIGKKNRPHCVLQTNNAVITLPAPDWGDTEAYGGVFTIRRSMNNIPYTHVRSLSLRKLKLPWTLAKRKAWELREFLLANNAKLMTLTTWKGDKWFVNLTTNPFELAVRGRYDAENEKVTIELEFEGLKVM